MPSFLSIALLVGGGLASVDVVLDAVGGVPAGQSVVVEFAMLEPPRGAKPTGMRRVTARTGERTPLTLPGAGAWHIRCFSDSLWCPPTMFNADVTGTATVSLPVFPRNQLAGRLRVRDAVRPPTRARVQLWTTPEVYRKRVLGSPFEVEVGERGSFSLDVPRVPLDLRLAVEGYSPLYLWGVNPERTTLPVLTLLRGSSLSGFAFRGVTRDPVVGAPARLLPLVSGHAAATFDRLTASTRSNERGFFQLAGVTPGRYRLVVTDSSGAEVHETVELAPDSELHLPRVQLQPLATLTVRLEPAMAPGGGQWRVALSGGSGEQAIHREAPASSAGAVRFEGLTTGTYDLQVMAEDGSRFGGIVHEVRGDGETRISLALLEVKGRVRLGSSPLAAEVSLEGGGGDKATFESDAEGRFAGSIRRPEWEYLRVGVRAPEVGVRRILELRELRIQGGVLRLDLDLAPGEVHGIVADRLGRPLAGVRVEASHGFHPAATGETDADGSFLLSGLEPATYWITARDRDAGDAQPMRVELTDARTSAELRISLIPPRRVEGVLLSSRGEAVAGARLVIHSVGGTGDSNARTDAAGRFRAQVQSGAAEASITVMAPSQLLWSGCVPIPTEDPWIVRLPAPTPGELDLEITGDARLPPAPGSVLVITEAGGLLSSHMVVFWRSMAAAGSTVPGLEGTIPAVAPAAYAVTWADLPGWWIRSSLCANGPPLGLDWVAVSAGGSARLSYDIRPHQRSEDAGGSRTSVFPEPP